MSRGLSPVVGIATLSLLTVTLAISMGMVLTTTPGESPPSASFSSSTDAGENRITITHEAGESVDIGDISLTIAIEGEKLKYQPDVPFFSERGFESGPTGALNPATDQTWHTGETVSLVIAETNSRTITPGSEVTVILATETIVLYEETIRA